MMNALNHPYLGVDLRAAPRPITIDFYPRLISIASHNLGISKTHVCKFNEQDVTMLHFQLTDPTVQ